MPKSEITSPSTAVPADRLTLAETDVRGASVSLGACSPPFYTFADGE